MEKRKWVNLHGDDFGVSLHGAQDIIDCLAEGELDSISVIPNMSCFRECVEIYQKKKEFFKKEPLICIHLNILDGKAVSEKGKIPDIVDGEGYFNLSWGKLFALNYAGKGKRERIKKQIRTEFTAQIRMVTEAFGLKEIRLDSHQHPHMIPFVFDALMEICDKSKVPVRFVRLAKEPLGPFLLQVSLYPTYSPVNLLKNILLNFYSVRDGRELRRRGIPYELLWGLLMSGYMDVRRMGELLEAVVGYAAKRRERVEILFHPGRMLPDEKTEEYKKEGFLRFYMSQNRRAEKEAVHYVNERLRD